MVAEELAQHAGMSVEELLENLLEIVHAREENWPGEDEAVE